MHKAASKASKKPDNSKKIADARAALEAQKARQQKKKDEDQWAEEGKEDKVE